MQAIFDAQDGSPKVFIKVKAGRRKYKDMLALLDTGHNGSLSLPLLCLIEIGAKLKTYGYVELANGSKVLMYYFEVKVEIDGTEKVVLASMIEDINVTEAIVGLELLSPYIAFIDFKNKKILIETEAKLKQGLDAKK
jgi:predicted aspartyl protease